MIDVFDVSLLEREIILTNLAGECQKPDSFLQRPVYNLIEMGRWFYIIEAENDLAFRDESVGNKAAALDFTV